MISTYIPSVASTKTLLLQMICLGVFVGIVFFPRIRLRSIYMAALAAVVLLPCVSFMRLNPDSYLYVLLSTNYLKNPVDFFRLDAGTVGQLVPGLVAALRALFGARDLNDPQVISESLQILFYAGVIVFLALSWASMKQSRAHRFSLGVGLGAASLLGILTSSGWYKIDFHSYNGEIFAVVLLAASSLVLLC